MSLVFCSWAWLIIDVEVMIPVRVAQQVTENEGEIFRSGSVSWRAAETNVSNSDCSSQTAHVAFPGRSSIT